jgi:hypothetical protein
MKDLRIILWQNLDALMHHHWGKANLNRLAREGGFPPATSTNLKKCKTYVQLDTLQKLALVFNVEPWSLLIDGFDPKNPPVRNLSRSEKIFYDKLSNLFQELKEKS